MAPDEPAGGRRRALLVATATFGDPGLAALRAPTGDVASLAAVLGDEAIGSFEVRELIDQPTEELRREIETFFGEGRPQDLLLLYVSGHGVLSQSRRFYFATASTSLQLLRSTAIEDSFVNDVMQGSRARSIVLVLDCCHSGAFGKGLTPKSAMTVDVEHRFEGQGRVTLSASTELEYAFEETDPGGINELDPAAPGSLFTRSLVEGLQSGDADIDEDGRISVDDLYDYLCRRVRERSVHQTPGMAGDIRGGIMIARSRRGAQLPAELARAVESSLAGIREGAVNELAALRATGSGGLAAAARDALEQLGHDDSRRVSAAALAALGRTAHDAPPAAPPPAVQPPSPPEPEERPPRQPWRPGKRWPVIAGVAVGTAAITAAAVLLLGGSEPEPAKAATPYRLSKDGSVKVVLGVPRGSEFGSESVAGVVLVDAMNDPQLLTGTLAGVPGRPGPHDGFGSAIASADFDRNGLADLAIGVPGKDGVSVLYSTDNEPRPAWIAAANLDAPPTVGAFGTALVARDFDHDGYADLAVGAPGTPNEQKAWEPGSIHLFRGGPKGLSPTDATKIAEAEKDHDVEGGGFGSLLAAGDVNGDGSLDLVEGGPRDDEVAPGHLSFCGGGPRGPTTCVDVRGDYPSSDLAVGKINDDRFADVVQGDARADDAGEIRVWLGQQSSGLAGKPQRITQDTPRLSGSPEAGDEFGNAVAVGEVTGDRWADIVVAARSDEGGGGSVSIVPGGAKGPDASGARSLTAPAGLSASAQFGGALSLLDYDGDGHPELIVGIDRVELDDALVAYVSRGEGGLNPDPEKATGLGSNAQLLDPESSQYIGR